jgi:probable HAF family extracellular repeat protein
MKRSTLKTTLSRIATFALSLAVFGGPVLGQEQGPIRYSITDLGPVGPPPGQPFVITTNGFVSGQVSLTAGANGVSHAVVWHGGSMQDISAPGLGGVNSAAFGVNIWEQVVGEAENGKLDPKSEDFCGFKALGFSSQAISCLPFMWQNGVMSALPTLRDKYDHTGDNGQAWQINPFGVAVGSSENTTADLTCPGLPSSPQVYESKPVVWYKPFFWGKPVVQELETVSGDPDGVAFAINDRGQAVGASGSCGAFNAITLTNLVPLHALLWQDGKPIDLGNLGGDGHFAGIYATGLNDFRQVVGVSDTTGDASFHGFLWQDGRMSDLQPLPGDSYSYATSISDKGLVLGLSLDANFNLRAAVWQNGKPTDLNTLVPADATLDLQTACSINREGQITGIALAKGTASDYHAYLATPIPDNGDSGMAATGVEGTSKENAKTLQQWRFGRLASQRSRTE